MLLHFSARHRHAHDENGVRALKNRISSGYPTPSDIDAKSLEPGALFSPILRIPSSSWSLGGSILMTNLEGSKVSKNLEELHS
jgi:hypothetical protein